VDAHRAGGQLGLSRVRLFDQLDAAIAAGPALVLAPAGFGKTTLLAQYARRHIGPAAAYQADAMEVVHGDTATRPLPDALPGDTSAVVADRSRVDPARAVADARELIRTARDDTSAVLEVMAEAAAEPGGLLLTLDRLDDLFGTPGEMLLAQILARRPRNVQILLAARRPPDANLMRHELGRDGAVIGIDDLRFRRWEVERLLDEVYGEPLPPEDSALLAQRTGGWPAGLALFHRGTRGRPMSDRCRAAATPLERWPAFRQLFDEEVLPGVPAEVLDLLMRTCVFDVLTADRCTRLLGADVHGGQLESLARRYSLPITTHGDSYRYESPFRAHLALLLAERLGPVKLREWHRRAAELLVAEDAYPEAGRSLARAGDWLALQLLLAEHGQAVVRQPASELLELVPGPYRSQEPWLVFAEAESKLNDAQISAAAELFGHAAALFKTRQAAGDEDGLRATERELDEVDALMRKSVTPRKGMHWSGWMRVAIGPHAVQSTRKVTDLAPAEAELARLIGAIYGGGVPEEITRETHTVGVDSRDSAIALVALRLVRTAIAVARGKASPGVLERIADEAESLGSGFVARLALGARSLGHGTYTAVDAYAVAAACRRAGDVWGYLLLSTVGAIREVRDGRLDEDRLGTLGAEATEMGAESIAVWADAFGALAKARRNAPGAAGVAQAALDRAKAADVSGADVIAVLALAVADPVRRPALLREAADRAAAAELPRSTLKFWLATYVGSPATVHQSPVTIRCFGGFAMTVNGRPLDLSQVRPRARSALRLLAMRAGRFVHREVLIEALWSDLAPAAATRNLQVTISALRGLLEPDSGRGRAQMLVRSGDAYGLVLPAGSYADTAAFSDAVQRWQQQRRSGSFAAEVDAMRAALAAYGGELLPEEGPADWAVEARDHFRQLATRVARELATAELTQGNVAEAIRSAEQCIARDEHDDEAWQVLLRAYARSATPAKALDARRRYAEMLARLGVAEPTEQQMRGHTPVPRQRRPWEEG